MRPVKKDRKVLNIVLAILIAVGLWLYVVNVENPTGTFRLYDLPIQVVGEDVLEQNGLMVTDLSHKSLNVKVTGKKKTFMRLSKKNTYLSVDVSTVSGTGDWTLSCKIVYPANVSTEGISVANWSSLKVDVTVEAQATKTVPVRGDFVGTEAEGYLAGTVRTDPATITVKGPADVLASVSYASVQVGGDRISDTLVETAPVALIGVDGEPVEDDDLTLGTREVTVTVPVRRVVSVPLTVSFRAGGGASAADVQCTVSPQAVTLVAEDGVDLPASLSLGEIDLAEIYGTTSVSLPIRLPHGATAWNAPSSASVSVSLDGLSTRSFAVSNIVLRDVTRGCSAALASATVTVLVRGAPAAVGRLSAEDLTVEVSLAGAAAEDGVQRFPAAITVSGEVADRVGVVGTDHSVAVRVAR